MSGSNRTPAEILTELGIREPDDLDIDAIAEHCGARITSKPLQGCEARILGYQDRAIITVNAFSSPERQRFSAGHELGHWMHDRGQLSFKCSDSNFTHQWFQANPEARANSFASDLLLPAGMFRPRARGLPVTFATVRELANTFRMSLTATAIRLVEYGWLPCMLVCNTDEERAWFIGSSDISGRFWPLAKPGTRSAAYVLRSRGTVSCPIDVRCDNWINHPHAYRYWIKEDSIILHNRTVLSLLWWEDEKQLINQEEYEERRFAERSDHRRNWD